LSFLDVVSDSLFLLLSNGWVVTYTEVIDLYVIDIDLAERQDGCDGGSGDEEQSEEGDDEVEVVKDSGSLTSTNKLTVEDMVRVCKHKELLWKEVTTISMFLLWTTGCGTKLNLRDGTTLT
jgi:hypothetical protein